MAVVSGASIQGVYRRATRALRTQSPLTRAKQWPSAFGMLPGRRVAGIARLIPEPRPRCARNRLRRPKIVAGKKKSHAFLECCPVAVSGNGAPPSMARTCAVAQASLRLSKFAPGEFVNPPRGFNSRRIAAQTKWLANGCLFVGFGGTTCAYRRLLLNLLSSSQYVTGEEIHSAAWLF